MLYVYYDVNITVVLQLQWAMNSYKKTFFCYFFSKLCRICATIEWWVYLLL